MDYRWLGYFGPRPVVMICPNTVRVQSAASPKTTAIVCVSDVRSLGSRDVLHFRTVLGKIVKYAGFQ